MKLLIAVDARLEAYDLYLACSNDYVDCVKVLLNAGECDHGAELTKHFQDLMRWTFFLKPQAQK